METSKKNLTTSGMNLYFLLVISLSISIMSTSIYLISHFYNMHFPDSLSEGSGLCDISSYFNCDAATFSPISHILGIPLGAFGLFIGLLFFWGSIFPSINQERTNKTLSLVNMIGCLALFFYSIIILKSLCPFCTLYYFLSILLWLLFHFKSPLPYSLSPKVIIIQFLIFIGVSYGFANHYKEKGQLQTQVAQKIIEEFKKLPSVGDPEYDTGHFLNKPFPTFKESPIRISVFSDFQCPYCERIANQLEKVIKRFPNKLSVQYFYYPLDMSCNSHVTRAMHQFACKAAALSICGGKEKFKEIHDELFANHEKISLDFLSNLAKKFQINLSNCEENQLNKDELQANIKQGESYSIKSTPTLIINGKKIEGAIPTIHLMALLEYLGNQK